jgi:hypothetical protein
MLKKKGTIPSEDVEKSSTLHTTSFTPQAQPSSNQENEKDVIRISPCVDIEYPFTEEGKPSCLSRACPKDKECKVCCKDWRNT